MLTSFYHQSTGHQCTQQIWHVMLLLMQKFVNPNLLMQCGERDVAALKSPGQESFQKCVATQIPKLDSCDYYFFCTDQTCTELSPQLLSKPYTHSPSVAHDHTYCRINLTHPLSCTTNRYIVGDRFHDGPKTSGHKKETCKFHHIDNCAELKEYKSVLSEVINSKIKTKRLQSSSQQNLVHYFTYNRLMDYWHNRKIVDLVRLLSEIMYIDLSIHILSYFLV